MGVRQLTTKPLMGKLPAVIEFDDEIALEADARWLIEYLERSSRDGVKFSDGQTVQVGWMVATIKREGRRLALYEPDFQTMPIVWIRSVTSTLKHLRQQKSVVESFDVFSDLLFPSLADSCLVGSDLEDSPEGIILERVTPTQNDSGWFVGSLSSELDYNKPTNLKRVSLYEASLVQPAMIMFLALPPGCRVSYSPDELCVALEDNELTPTEGSFCASLS